MYRDSLSQILTETICTGTANERLMRELVLGPIAEALGVAFYIGIASVLTVVGAMAEMTGIENLTAGQTTLGAWEAVIGILMIYAAYNVAAHIVAPRVRGTDSSA